MHTPITAARAIAPLLGMVAAVVLVLPANASGRSKITISGQVRDEAGAPVPEAWIFVNGSRRASVLSDRQGDFSVAVLGGTVAEMARRPLELWVEARKKDWRFRLPTGDSRLGLEVTVVQDSSGSRLLVRSNLPRAAANVANAAVLDPSMPVGIALDFVATAGAPEGTESIELSSQQQVLLVGRGGLAGETAPAEDSASGGPPPGAGAAGGRAEPESPGGARRHQEPPDDRVQSAREVVGVSGSGRGARSDAGREARPETRPAPAPAEETPVERSPRATPDERPATEDSPEPTVRKHVWEPAERAEGGSWLLRPFEFLGRMFGVGAPRIEPPAGDGVERPKTAVEEAPVARPAAPPPAEAEAKATVARGAPAEAGAKATASRPAPAKAQPYGVDPKTCRCRVEGTVEVEANFTLTERTRVVVTIEDHPEVSDTVELFMGAPREFVLKSMPCGVHKVEFWAVSEKMFFKPATAEPVIECTPGGFQQIRLVLKPFARRTFW